MANNYYRDGSSSTAYYPASSYRTEIDMRQELANTLDGKHPEIAKSQTGLIRKARLNSNGGFIECGCVDTLTREPDKDRFCPSCFSDGKLWNEYLITYYRVSGNSGVNSATLNSSFAPGIVNVGLVIFYIKYNAAITRFDKLVILNTDTEGNPITPYIRKTVYKIEQVWDFRADNGKLEYFKVFTHEDNVKYINAPTYNQLLGD